MADPKGVTYVVLAYSEGGGLRSYSSVITVVILIHLIEII